MTTGYLTERVRCIPQFAIERFGRLAAEHGAIDLALGAPEWPAPTEVKEAAIRAIRRDANQYVDFKGLRALREAIAERAARDLAMPVDPEREVTVTCGASGAISSVLVATLEPGDEVVIFEPFYAQHVVAAGLQGAVPRCVPLREPAWTFDREELVEAFGPRTKAIVVSSPHNPTGRVLDEDELRLVAELCRRWDVLCVSDETYAHILFDGRRHRSPAGLDGMRERTVVIGSLSKSYSVSGWRLGHVIAPAALTAGIRAVHSYLTACAPAPLQVAGTVALGLPDRYYRELSARYQASRDLVVGAMERMGFTCARPQGAFYLMAGIAGLGFDDDVACATWLLREAGVAFVPGGSFYRSPASGREFVRVCFGRTEVRLTEAMARLAAHLPAPSRRPAAAPTN